jgi:hypothetical protein
LIASPPRFSATDCRDWEPSEEEEECEGKVTHLMLRGESSEHLSHAPSASHSLPQVPIAIHPCPVDVIFEGPKVLTFQGEWAAGQVELVTGKREKRRAEMTHREARA